MLNILLAGGLAMVVTLLGTKWYIKLLVRKHYGQFIRDDGPTSHHTKRGTPTMGGVIIIVATILGYGVAHLITWTPPRASGLLELYLFTAVGLVGFLDDYIKIRKQRSLGLNARAKLILQSVVGASFAYLSLTQWDDARGNNPASTAISFLRDINWLQLPLILAILWIMLLIASASNSVNLTDGLDGLATGASTMVFGAYAVLNIWQYNQWCALASSLPATCYEVRDPRDLSVVAMAMAGACFGFLWWNAKPAKIFLGDTGSEALGAAMAAFAVFTRTELLLVILGFLFVIEALSDIIQVGYFKASGGKRVFKMAPLHHHFELLGWQEVTVVVRFWIICGVAVCIGLGLFYAQWVVAL